MPETENYWLEMMKQRHSTDEEGVKAIMRERGKRGPEVRKAKGGEYKGGFSDPEFARKAGVKGRDTRFGKTIVADENE